MSFLSIFIAADYGGTSDDEGDGRDAWGAMQAVNEGDDGELLSAPRKVANTSITYARASKQVHPCVHWHLVLVCRIGAAKIHGAEAVP